MSVQVKRRREAASFLAGFVGAPAELIVDTTNNRVQVHDGTTAGGWPAAKLSEVVTNTRTAVADANYTALSSDRLVAYTAITAARVLTLPASSGFPTGTGLVIVDESGACSASHTITVTRAGPDTINGAPTVAISTPYGFVALESNGAGKWTILDQTPSLAGTGAVVYNSSQSLTAAQQAQAVANIGAVTGGFVNKVRNPGIDVDQRGTGTTALTVTTSGAYVVDGFIVLPTGASVAAGQAAAPTGSISGNCLKITGAASNTDVVVRHRIESVDAAKLAGATVTVQCKLYNASGASITPKLSIGHPSTADTYSSVGAASLTNEVNAANMQAAANATLTQLAYTATISASATNGLECNVDFGALASSGDYIEVTDFDVRVTSGVATGLNATPPTPEFRPFFSELEFNQRFFFSTFGNGVPLGASTTAGMVGGSVSFVSGASNSVAIQLPVPMRAAGSLRYWDGASHQNCCALVQSGGTSFNNGQALNEAPYNISATSFFFAGLASAGDQASFIHVAISAEL